jgi:hypothetical protein
MLDIAVHYETIEATTEQVSHLKLVLGCPYHRLPARSINGGQQSPEEREFTLQGFCCPPFVLCIAHEA